VVHWVVGRDPARWIYVSGTLYISHVRGDLLFGVNFADGRTKGYGLTMPDGSEKSFFVKCVRGNTSYGLNSFVNNGDSTITDRSTGLIWSQADSRSAMNWQSALARVQAGNGQNYLGHSDWRLPDVKELQSIVDYTRAPDVTKSAAINPVFLTTSTTNEAGQTDYPYFWASTTHENLGTSPASYATYVAFGRAMGYMSGWGDVHGAGAQRSDPEDGDPADYPYGYGPQGDAIYIFNYVRLVRGPIVAPRNVDVLTIARRGDNVILRRSYTPGPYVFSVYSDSAADGPFTTLVGTTTTTEYMVADAVGGPDRRFFIVKATAQ
jgi:hypothetical protein